MSMHFRAFAGSGLLLAAVCANAQPGPPGRDHGSPPHEVVAITAGLTPAQQTEVRRIEATRRDAHDELAIKQRGEHRRIDEEADKRLRGALGDEGYQRYLEAKVKPAHGPREFASRGGPGPRGGDGPAPRRDAPARDED